jgi:hypothetical protein
VAGAHEDFDGTQRVYKLGAVRVSVCARIAAGSSEGNGCVQCAASLQATARKRIGQERTEILTSLSEFTNLVPCSADIWFAHSANTYPNSSSSGQDEGAGCTRKAGQPRRTRLV